MWSRRIGPARDVPADAGTGTGTGAGAARLAHAATAAAMVATEATEATVAPRVRIFRICHKVDGQHMNRGMFSDLMLGEHDAADGSYLGDLGGVNIAGLNEHSEMRAHYHVWKSRLEDVDYVGFEHYRRLIFLDFMAYDEMGAADEALPMARLHFMRHAGAECLTGPFAFDRYLAFRRAMTDAQAQGLAAFVGGYDIIALRPQKLRVRDQMDDGAFKLLEAAVRNAAYFRTRRMLIDFDNDMTCYRSMFVMTRACFDEYMGFWWDVIGFIARNRACPPRSLGYFSERIFALYLFQKRMESPMLRILFVPYLIPS